MAHTLIQLLQSYVLMENGKLKKKKILLMKKPVCLTVKAVV